MNATDDAATEPTEPTGGTGLGHREISMQRTALGAYLVTNIRGGQITIGGGDSADFTPVELLLTAIAGCSAVDVDHLTSRRAEPESFTVSAAGTKTKDDGGGNVLADIEVTFTLRFPAGEDGDKARAMVPRAIAASHDRLCTVSRTVQAGTPVEMRIG
mgnify:CR=1 FL=1